MGSVGAAASASAFSRLTPTQWVICAVAALGFAFDLYEIVILPLVVRPVLMTVGNLKPGSREFNLWVGLMFYVPLACGGVLGCLEAT